VMAVHPLCPSVSGLVQMSESASGKEQRLGWASASVWEKASGSGWVTASARESVTESGKVLDSA